MKAGLYVLARLDGPRTDDPLDLRTLGFAPDDRSASRSYHGAQCSIGLADLDPGALDLWVSPEEVCGLAGYLDEPEELAAMLGQPSDTPHARLAAVAIERFGPEAAHRVLGEWELVRWQPDPACLTLMSSRSRRDLLYFHTHENLFAAAPEPMRLARLSGPPQLDPVHLALHCSRYGLRRILADESIWKGVHELAPATWECFTAGGRTTTHAREIDDLPSWHGSFEDAVECLEMTGRRILRQHLGRHPRLAFQLSGGQDSTLLTCWGALERQAGQSLLCLCSAAAQGSRFRDESVVSAAAAAQLGLPLELVVPPPDWSPYRPRPEAFAFSQNPMFAEAHPANRALHQAARNTGRTAIVGGAFGEITVTGGATNEAARSWLRNRREQLRRWTKQTREPRTWPNDAFQVRFTQQVTDVLPSAWQADWKQGPPPFVDGVPGKPIGIGSAVRKSAWENTSAAADMRLILPYRDRRLVEAAAVLPSAFRNHGGLTRALSRALLRGHVPDSVRLRTQKLPFSPDFRTRIHVHAPAALARLPGFQDAGVGRWIDLAWLRQLLDRAAGGHVTHYDEIYQLQMTAVAAEFLLWLATQNVRL